MKEGAFAVKYNVRLILGFDFDEKWIYEFRLKDETVNMTIWDFSLVYSLTSSNFFAKMHHHNIKINGTSK